MRQECRERFPRHQLQRGPLVSDPGMHHGTCVTRVPWCMLGSFTRGGRGKCSQHSQRMRNPQFYVSGKRPMQAALKRLVLKPKHYHQIRSRTLLLISHCVDRSSSTAMLLMMDKVVCILWGKIFITIAISPSRLDRITYSLTFSAKFSVIILLITKCTNQVYSANKIDSIIVTVSWAITSIHQPTLLPFGIH